MSPDDVFTCPQWSADWSDHSRVYFPQNHLLQISQHIQNLNIRVIYMFRFCHVTWNQSPSYWLCYYVIYETMHLSNMGAIGRSIPKILSDLYWIHESVRHQVFYWKLYVGGVCVNSDSNTSNIHRQLKQCNTLCRPGIIVHVIASHLP